MPEPKRWAEGAAEIEGMVDRGELEYVEPSRAHAELLMNQAEGHLNAARPLVQVHPPSAFTLLYEGARKAMTALLAKQGLRPTRAGGHVAVQSAAEAQLGRNTRHMVRSFRTLRRRRNESEYPAASDPPVTADEARDALRDARSIVEIMRRMLPYVGPFGSALRPSNCSSRGVLSPGTQSQRTVGKRHPAAQYRTCAGPKRNLRMLSRKGRESPEHGPNT